MGQNQCAACLYQQNTSDFRRPFQGFKYGFARLGFKHRQRLARLGLQYHLDTKRRTQLFSQVQNRHITPLLHGGGAIHQIAGFIAAGHGNTVAAVRYIERGFVDIALNHHLPGHPHLAFVVRADRPMYCLAAHVFGALNVKCTGGGADAAADGYARPAAVQNAVYQQLDSHLLLLNPTTPAAGVPA